MAAAVPRVASDDGDDARLPEDEADPAGFVSELPLTRDEKARFPGDVLRKRKGPNARCSCTSGLLHSKDRMQLP